MSLLLDKKELRKAAKEITTIKLQEVIDTLNAVLVERQKETEALDQVRTLLKAQGLTLEQLGYKLDAEAPVAAAAPVEPIGKRPIKPKFKTINKESQFFYVDGGTLHLLKTHTMKQGLLDRGIKVVPFHKVETKYSKDVDALLADAGVQAVENFNAKVDVWNLWAQANGDELLQKK